MSTMTTTQRLNRVLNRLDSFTLEQAESRAEMTKEELVNYMSNLNPIYSIFSGTRRKKILTF